MRVRTPRLGAHRPQRALLPPCRLGALPLREALPPDGAESRFGERVHCGGLRPLDLRPEAEEAPDRRRGERLELVSF